MKPAKSTTNYRTCLFLIGIILLFGTNVRAQVYQGTIGKYPVVFELMPQEEGYYYQARYYYTKVKTDLYLHRDEDNTNVYRTNEDDPAKREALELKVQGKKISGTWTQNGKKLTIALSRIDTSQIAPAKTSAILNHLRSEDPYAYLKLQDVQFTKTKEEKWDSTTTLEWYKEELSQVEFFRIKSSTHLKDPAKVNRLLREKHLEEVVAWMACMNGSPGPGEYAFSGKLVYLSSQLISISCQVTSMCYGARPWLSVSAITADCSSLQRLQLHDLFWLKDTEASRTAWHTLVKKNYDLEASSDEDCQYDTHETWNMGQWFLTKEGLHIYSYLHSNPHCAPSDDWPVVPYKDLVKYRVNKEKYLLE